MTWPTRIVPARRRRPRRGRATPTSHPRPARATLGRREIDRLLAPLTDVVLSVDAGGTIAYASPPLGALLGFAPDDLVGTRFADLVEIGPESLSPTVLLAHAQREAGVRARLHHADGGARRDRACPRA